jgi:hypothetical protein
MHTSDRDFLTFRMIFESLVSSSWKIAEGFVAVMEDCGLPSSCSRPGDRLPPSSQTHRKYPRPSCVARPSLAYVSRRPLSKQRSRRNYFGGALHQDTETCSRNNLGGKPSASTGQPGFLQVNGVRGALLPEAAFTHCSLHWSELTVDTSKLAGSWCRWGHLSNVCDGPAGAGLPVLKRNEYQLNRGSGNKIDAQP